ncbi:MAG TPA: ABC transporter permease [Streptomyces sp.]|uniref:ABC transporter permease n=1 Tax=Streptomyces sp. TaxID=1931 RepID=UPI002CAB7505|nr:ABC transporter permease [Streptomyces sp.]HWU11184.1 ABC transporter permease [Streptomyces sp.]
MSATQAPATATTKAEPSSRLPAWVRNLGSGTGGPLVGLVVLCVALFIATPFFLTANNLLNILDQVTILGILALGMTFVIITAGIDLSVAAVLALSMMVLGWTSHNAGWPLWLSIIAAILVGGLCGLVSGLGVTVTKLPPFIATLAMLSIARGTANVITDGQQIVGYPDWFTALSTERHFGFLTITALVLIVLLVLGWAFLRYRPGGREVYAVGGSAEVARLAGIKVKRVTTSVYVLSGLLAGLAGVVLAARLDSSQPSAAVGLELDVIAAVVIGGASLSGGVGRVPGTVVGVLIIGVLRNGLNLLSVSPFVQQIVIGVVIALAVMVDVLQRRSD